MEDVIERSITKINKTSEVFERYLRHDINLGNRLIAIKGARGTGKTTLLLQIGKKAKQNEVLYVALDDLFFNNYSLYSLADKFQKIGGKLLLLDEVHKYPQWSRELKLIYDDFEELNVVFTSSSILDIYQGESDLSRRAISYTLDEMSFREYLEYRENIKLPAYSFKEILKNHTDISIELNKKLKPFKYFSSYLKYGSYPYYDGDEREYYQRLMNTVNLIFDVDMQSIEKIDYNSIAKFKKLLYMISSNVPFVPNINRLSEKLVINRNTLVRALQLLNKAELIKTMYKQNKSISILNKPDKIWLHNTNLMYAISKGNVNIGNVRETFLLQVLSQNHDLTLPENGDVLVDEKYILEVGGKNKQEKQIKDIPNSYIVKDDIEIGVLNNIPLWLFGFLY